MNPIEPPINRSGEQRGQDECCDDTGEPDALGLVWPESKVPWHQNPHEAVIAEGRLSCVRASLIVAATTIGRSEREFAPAAIEILEFGPKPGVAIAPVGFVAKADLFGIDNHTGCGKFRREMLARIGGQVRQGWQARTISIVMPRPGG